MNASDLARLELAKRAYRATEPNEVEVQRGVRRARLALRRPKQRRRWFSKGLVMVVLAIGSLAYAKPHALGELVSSVLERDHGAGNRHGGGGRGASVAPREEAPPPRAQELALAAPATDSITAPASPAEQPEAASAVVARKRPEKQVPMAAAAPASVAPSAAQFPGAEAARAGAAVASDWGRVGQALAQGDEAKALSALATLSESDDPRTRDKADLGRAQLLLSHGNKEQGCALARQLTHRQAGSRIERQAQALLKDCAR